MCSNLISVTIPESVNSIGEAAFAYCSSLTSVNIPASVNYIENWAFLECTDLTSVYYMADIPISGNTEIFSDATYSDATLYMSEEGIRLGSLTDPWKNFKTIKIFNPSGIDEVIRDFDENAPYEVYNFDGLKVAENSIDGLMPGLYIRKQGKKIEKFIVK